MRIYGDVIVAKFNEENSSIISLIYDAKNGFGAYGGKTEVIIMLTPDSDPVYVAEDSPYFMDIRDTYEEIEELSQNIESGKVEKSETTDRILNTISFEVLQGDKVADLLKIEHYDN